MDPASRRFGSFGYASGQACGTFLVRPAFRLCYESTIQARGGDVVQFPAIALLAAVAVLEPCTHLKSLKKSRTGPPSCSCLDIRRWRSLFLLRACTFPTVG